MNNTIALLGGDGDQLAAFICDEVGRADPLRVSHQAEFVRPGHIIHAAVFLVGVIKGTPKRNHAIRRSRPEVSGILMQRLRRTNSRLLEKNLIAVEADLLAQNILRDGCHRRRRRNGEDCFARAADISHFAQRGQARSDAST